MCEVGLELHPCDRVDGSHTSREGVSAFIHGAHLLSSSSPPFLSLGVFVCCTAKCEAPIKLMM